MDFSSKCTPFRSWTTFWLPALGAEKMWYLRSYTTRTFQINFPRLMASVFLVPLAKRCVLDRDRTFSICVKKSKRPVWNGKCNEMVGIHRNQRNQCSGLCQTTILVYNNHSNPCLDCHGHSRSARSPISVPNVASR